MKILKPCEDDSKKFSSLVEDYMKNSIFLAGPCPRKNYEKKNDVWRKEAYSIFEDIGFDGDILNPTNKNYGLMKDLTK